jgi:hypothetical protein
MDLSVGGAFEFVGGFTALPLALGAVAGAADAESADAGPAGGLAVVFWSVSGIIRRLCCFDGPHGTAHGYRGWVQGSRSDVRLVAVVQFWRAALGTALDE